MDIYAVDPGTEESALVVYRPTDKLVDAAIILPNARMLEYIKHDAENYTGDVLVIEQIVSYGMSSIGREVFETVFWSGRFYEAWVNEGERAERIDRRTIKRQICNSVTARDSNIRTEILDRFGGKKRAFGKKSAPGPLFGVTSHKMAALAVAIAWWEINGEKERS